MPGIDGSQECDKLGAVSHRVLREPDRNIFGVEHSVFIWKKTRLVGSRV